MKKSLILLSFMTLFLPAISAGTVLRPGFVVLRPIYGAVDVRPGIRPFSNPVDPFSLCASDSQIVLTSETVNSEVQLWVMNGDEVVDVLSETLSVGADMSIDLTDYPSGAYTIYIMCNGSVWEGEFEIL